MSYQFKEGDRVRYTGKLYGLTDKEGTVTEDVLPDHWCAFVRWDHNGYVGQPEVVNLELVPADVDSMEDVFYKYVREAENIYKNRTAGDYTWSGLLAQFIFEMSQASD